MLKAMKNIFIFRSLFFAAVIIFSAQSCSDDFLDIPVQGGVTTESDPGLAQDLVNGVYASLLQGDSWGNGDVHGFAFVSVTSIMSDDAEKGSTASDQQVPVGDLDNFTITSTNKFAESLWSGHYNSIGAANQALQALENAAIDDALRNRLRGEVQFLRGYLYFNLVRMYGGVPLVLRVPADATDANNDPAFQTRASVDQIYAAIIDDLKYASRNLLLKSQSQTGRATKGAAQALLAKVFMYRQDWQNAFAYADSVITSGQYSLLEDYGQIWRQSGDNSAESIFEIQTGEFNNANLKIDNYTVSQGVRVGGSGGWDDLGWGFNNPTTSLISAYEAGDLRRDQTIIFIDNSGTHKGTRLWDGFRVPSKDSVQNLYYNYKAYSSRFEEEYANLADKDRPKNIKILRYAEVLLIYAEAAIHTGLGNADEKLNMVRTRAGLSPKSGATIADVWQERHVELGMEHDRFWDIIRQGRAAVVMHAAGKTNFTAGVHELLPIPNSEILLSGNKLQQNFGY
jgi:starch-binding outer membrane protein, SusD/RagB family